VRVAGLKQNNVLNVFAAAISGVGRASCNDFFFHSIFKSVPSLIFFRPFMRPIQAIIFR